MDLSAKAMSVYSSCLSWTRRMWFPLPVLSLTHPGILRPSICTCLTSLWRTFCDLFSLRNKKLVIESAFSETRNLAVIRCNSGSEILKIADCYNSV